MKPRSFRTRACRPPITCGSTFPIPAPASRPTSSTRSSSRSSRPRRSARAPGLVYVDSTPGEGTTFRIFLPRHRPELEAQPEAQATNGAAREGAAQPPKPRPDLTGQGTILLVEDEDGLRSLNARGLRSRGYSV